ncbi:MAG: MBL fold metallo-hydrolase [Methylocystaceae bacterium]
MFIKGMEVGAIASNCYLVGCEETKKAIIIDPGAAPNAIINMIKGSGYTVETIVNTHGHVDHIGANDEVKKFTGAKIVIHRLDAKMLTSSAANFSMFMGRPVTSGAADELLDEGDVVKAGNLELKVLHTPGHTPGGICLVADNVIFSGDTLFYGSIGRTDFPGGSYETLIRSIKDKLMVYSDDTVVYPGHGPATSIGFERQYNPFL